MPHPASTKVIVQVLRELWTTRDQARLNVHLFSLEARQRWSELEAKLQAFEDRLTHDRDKALDITVAKARGLTRAARAFIEAEGQGPVKPPAIVNEIMSTSVRTCRSEAPLSEAARVMWEADCGAVPIVDSNEDVIGIVTDRDICMAAYTRGQPLSTCSVDSVMSRPVYSCAPEDSVEMVAELMETRQIRRLPVIDGRLVGIVAIADLAWHIRGMGDRANGSWLLAALSGISSRLGKDARFGKDVRNESAASDQSRR